MLYRVVVFHAQLLSGISGHYPTVYLNGEKTYMLSKNIFYFIFHDGRNFTQVVYYFYGGIVKNCQLTLTTGFEKLRASGLVILTDFPQCSAPRRLHLT